MDVISTEQLAKRYGRRVGIDGLSLNVPDGSIFGFLGPNGSGKTTTIRLLVGLLKPTRGSASLFGLRCWRDGPRIREEVGYLPGDLRLYPWLTCTEALRGVGRIRRRSLRREGLALAERFGLDPDLRVEKMSRGTRQKLGLVLTLAHRPRLLILDEPTASLDPLMQETLYADLRSLAADGHTVFLSSHALSEVEKLCRRVAILREGRMVADETVDALRERAGRSVTIRWHSAGPAGTTVAPPFLKVSDRRDCEWVATLHGPSMDLVRWSATRPIADVSIDQPDLSALFQQYYAPRERVL